MIPLWKQYLHKSREAIRNNVLNELQDIINTTFPNKEKTLERALKLAVYYNNIDALKILLDVTINKNWNNALYHAITHKRLEIIDILSKIVDEDMIEDAIFDASSKNKVDVLNVLFKNIKNTNNDSLNYIIWDSFFYAACYGRLDVVKYLFPYIKKTDVEFAFNSAVLNAQSKIVEWFLPYIDNPITITNGYKNAVCGYNNDVLLILRSSNIQIDDNERCDHYHHCEHCELMRT